VPGPIDALAGRLPDGAVSTDPAVIAARAHDRWALALLRAVRGDPPPAALAVVTPRSVEEVAETLRWAGETRTAVVPRGAGSGVSGGAQASAGAILLDLSAMDRVLEIDETSLAVSVQAGARGNRLEEALGTAGLTLGHYPQSLAISTVGGWIAAFSAGQSSAGYGAIEDLVLGMTAVLAGGEVIRLAPRPRSAAGPDLRRWFIGSEGTLGVVVEAVLSASPLPGRWAWDAYRPAGFEEGFATARAAAQRRVHPLVVRLYDEPDAALSFGSLGHRGGPVLLFGWDAAQPWAVAQRDAVRSWARAGGTEDLDAAYGAHWWEHRNDAVRTYERVMGEERLFGPGVVVDTMEVAALWRDLPALYPGVRQALLARAEAVGCHLSHTYRAGASLYYTFLYRAADDRAAEEGYLALWREAVAACHAAGGTMTHHHGVGLLKASSLEAELGAGGISVLRRVKDALDPDGLLNPGKLLS